MFQLESSKKGANIVTVPSRSGNALSGSERGMDVALVIPQMEEGAGNQQWSREAHPSRLIAISLPIQRLVLLARALMSPESFLAVRPVLSVRTAMSSDAAGSSSLVSTTKFDGCSSKFKSTVISGPDSSQVSRHVSSLIG
jgi:hypothetical protein